MESKLQTVVVADIFGNNSDGIIVQVDNQSTLKVIRNPTAYQVVKHVDIRLKYLRGVYTSRTSVTHAIYTCALVVLNLTTTRKVCNLLYL